MRREVDMPRVAPVRVAQLTKALFLGGTEVQVIELLRGLPPSYQCRLALLEEDGALLDQARSLGFVPETFPLAGSLMRAQTLAQIRRLAAWLREEKISLVHAHDFYSAALAVPAARLARVKVVVSRLDLAHHLQGGKRLLWRQLSRLAHHVVANADAIRQMLIGTERLAPDRVTVIRNGIDLPRFDARLRAGTTQPLPEVGDAPVAVLVANMNHPVKRQEDFLRAVALVRRRVPKLQAFLVGDGPRGMELQALAVELGLAEVAHFLSYRDDVPAIYARAQVAVNCSAAEGLSNAVIEAMAARVPVVATHVGGNPELVEHGVRGQIVPAGRPELLAEGLLTALVDRERAIAMAKNARTFVERQLTLTRMARAHDALYRRVIHFS